MWDRIDLICHPAALSLGNQRVFDWLDEKFIDKVLELKMCFFIKILKRKIIWIEIV